MRRRGASEEDGEEGRARRLDELDELECITTSTGTIA